MFPPSRPRVRSIYTGPRIIQAGPIRKMEGWEIHRFIDDFTPDELRQAKELWRAYAGRGDLIEFTADEKRSDLRIFANQGRGVQRDYGYNPQTLSYYVETSRGRRVIPDISVKLDINRFVAGVQAEARALMAQLVAGTIDPQRWYDETARLAKLSYRVSADIARGSDEQMSQEERSHWLEAVLLLLLFLNDITDVIESGRMPANGIALAQAGRLIGSGNGLFENWRLWSASVSGYTEARRILGVNENHCHDTHERLGCIELARLGWVPIDKFVPIGLATCRQHCKCRADFRRES